MKRVIFVCGTARCGSTLVDLVLGNDPRGFALGEVASWYHPWRTHHFDIKCGCGVYPCPLWEEMRAVPEDRLYRTLFDTRDLDFISDSSKSLTWVIDQNRRLMRDAEVRPLNLFFYKDPVALYYSHWKRGDRDIDKIAGRYRYYEQALQAKIPFVAVNYDWFVSAPEAALEKLCAVVEVPYTEGKLRFWEKEHHHLFGSFGPRAQLAQHKAKEIYVEERAPEFVEREAELRDRMEADPRLPRILRALEARDLRRVDAHPRSIAPSRPLFYWRLKLQWRRRRHNPEPSLDREASLIREWRL